VHARQARSRRSARSAEKRGPSYILAAFVSAAHCHCRVERTCCGRTYRPSSDLPCRIALARSPSLAHARTHARAALAPSVEDRWEGRTRASAPGHRCAPART